MQFMNIFRKKRRSENPLREVGISEANLILKQKLEKDKKKSRRIKAEISEKITEFISGLSDQIKVLDSIDLEKKREQEKIKLITSKGLEEYIRQLKKLIDDLKNLDAGEKFGSYVENIKQAIKKFARNSHKNLEKATILIGTELAQTEEMIKTFGRAIETIIQQNMDLILEEKKLNKLGELGESYEETAKIIREIRGLIKKSEETKEKLSEKRNERKRGLGVFRESEEFKDWLREKSTLEKDRKKLEKDADLLKKKIDFKSLLNKFHCIPRDFELLKNYKEDFSGNLKNDENLRILDLIEGDKRQIIEGRLREISDKLRHLELKRKSYRINQKEEIFVDSIKKAECQIETLEKDIEKERKKMRKFLEKESMIKEERIGLMENLLGDTKILGETFPDKQNI